MHKIVLKVNAEALKGEKFVKITEDDQIGFVGKYEESTLFEFEQKAFEVRKEIISKLGGKTKVDFVL